MIHGPHAEGLEMNDGERGVAALPDGEQDVGWLLCGREMAALYETEGGERGYQRYKYGQLGEQWVGTCVVADSSGRDVFHGRDYEWSSHSKTRMPLYG